MKKIGLITFNDYLNYGNRLQNYALQEVVKYLGFEVETIKIILEANVNNDIRSRLTRIRNLSFEEFSSKLLNKIWRIAHKKRINYNIALRKELFKKFTDNFIIESNYIITNNNIPDELNDAYDFFITGSDQVWNPNYNYGSSVYFLTFASKHKRIAYAPSFGVSHIAPEYTNKYKMWLSEMYRLSVREEDGAKIIKELTGMDVPVLIDPTLLLTKEKWLSIAKEAKNKPKQNYLLTYFLGVMTKKYNKQIKNIAKKNKLKIINLGNIRDWKTYITDPSEFIDYINSCSIFCTDSFHGVVFSILFEKPFIAFERKGGTFSMISRIDTLLKKFNLESRKAENIKLNKDVFDVNFSHVPQVLELERKKAFNYLKESLNVI